MSMRFKRVYLEITNVCNLNCSFCHGTKRVPRFLTPGEFDLLAGKLRNDTEYLYFHLMGEPLLHPELGELLRLAHSHGFKVNLTTNGFLLPEVADVLLAAPALHRINISLQSWEANQTDCTISHYVNSCCAFAHRAAAQGILVSFRLWNGGGEELCNPEILHLLHAAFPNEWKKGQHNLVLGEGIFLEYGEKFDWPDPDAGEHSVSFCRGLRDHLGVLCDGTVVPCCLDADGTLALGNLFASDLHSILESPRARAIYDGFSRRQAVESLCQRCGYAARFS